MARYQHVARVKFPRPLPITALTREGALPLTARDRRVLDLCTEASYGKTDTLFTARVVKRTDTPRKPWLYDMWRKLGGFIEHITTERV